MAVLRQDLLRSTFQERQIDLLSSLEKSVRKTAEDLPSILERNSDRVVDSMDDLLMKLSKSMESLYRTGIQSYVSGTGRVVSNAVREGFHEDQKRREDEAKSYRSMLDKQHVDMKDKLEAIIGGITKIADTFGLSLERALDEGARYSELQNMFVRDTGLTRSLVTGYRKDLMDVVSQMNKRSGGLYNGLESYELIVGLINTTGIKNLEFYEEYGDLFLETQKTMNVNLGTLAEFSDKFYRKYNFSSSTMEDLMDSVRVNTAGTSVSADTLTTFMNTVTPDLMHVANTLARTQGGSIESHYTRLTDTLEKAYVGISEQGFDAEYLLSTFLNAMNGDMSAITQLSVGGVQGVTDLNFFKRFMEDPASLVFEYLQNIGNVYNQRAGTFAGKTTADIYGVDFETLMLAGMKAGSTDEEWQRYLGSRSLVSSENPEDEIYLSAEDRVANHVSLLYDDVSDLSETLGMDLSTIIRLLGTITSTIISVTGLKALLGTAGGQSFLSTLFGGTNATGGLSTLLGGAKGLLAKAGPIAGGVAVVATLVDTFYSLYKQGKDEEFRTAEIEAAGTDARDSKKYLTYNPDGTISYIDSWSDAFHSNSPDAIRQSAVASVEKNQGKIQAASDWVVTNIFGKDPESVKLTHDNSYLGNTYYIALHNTAMKQYQEGNSSALEWLNAYHDKGVMKDAWQWEWLVSPEYNNGQNMIRAMQMFDEESKLLYPTKNWLGRIQETTIPAYAIGTPFVPEDQLALVHQGEAIIPAAYNPYTRIGSDYSLRSYENNSRMLEVSESYLPYLKSMNETLTQIREFLKFWRLDTIDRDAITSVMEAAKSTATALSSITGNTVTA